jgi:hypothetical protein
MNDFGQMVGMMRRGQSRGNAIPQDMMEDPAFVADFIKLIAKRGGDWRSILSPTASDRQVGSHEFAQAPMRPGPQGQSFSENMAMVPRVWKSAPDHEAAVLSYITPTEMQMLRDADIYGSNINERMHYGPGKVPSLQGDGPGGGGGGAGDSGGGDGPSGGAGGGTGSDGDPGGTDTGGGGGGKGGSTGGSDPHGMGGFGEGAIGGPNVGGAPGHQGGSAGSVGGPGGGAGSPSSGGDMDPFGMGQFGEIGAGGPNRGAAPGHQGIGGFQGVNSLGNNAEGISGADQGGFIGGEKRSIGIDNFASAVLDVLGMRDPEKLSHDAVAKGVLGMGLGTLVTSIPTLAEKMEMERDPETGEDDGPGVGGDNGPGNSSQGGPPRPPQAQGPKPFTRPQERGGPSFLSLHPAMSNLQRRAAIATFATQGMDNRYRDNDTKDYWRNLIERALITDTGDLAEFGNVLPIELQYIQQVLGKGSPNSTQSLLEAIAAS